MISLIKKEEEEERLNYNENYILTTF